MRARVLALLVAASVVLLAAISERAVELRNRGIAQLENEQPAEAEKTFTELTRQAADAPLGWANLAVAALRQQDFDAARKAIVHALELAPGRADLLAIEGEIEQWAGNLEQAVAILDRAASAAPRDVDIQYSLLRSAHRLPGNQGKAAADRALDRLVDLRPDNVVVQLERGQRAILDGDRATASKVFLRVSELLWQAPDIATKAAEEVRNALAQGTDTGAARVPALRLENVLKVTPMYQQALRELTTGIQGTPVVRFADEPPPTDFGQPLPVRFLASVWEDAPLAGAALAVGDFDGDRKPDVAWIGGDPARLRIRRATSPDHTTDGPAAAGIARLLAVDLDNDGQLDLVGSGAGRLVFFRGAGDGTFTDATTAIGLQPAQGTVATALDFDLEGDLDLVVAAGDRLELWRNDLSSPLEAVGRQAFGNLAVDAPQDLVASDLDRDGDLDLLLVEEHALHWLDNLRQGEFRDRTEAGGLAGRPGGRAAAAADLDGDGWPDVVVAGASLDLYHNLGGKLAPWRVELGKLPAGPYTGVAVLDADNDGRLDLALAGSSGVTVLQQQAEGGFRALPVQGGGAPRAALDADGDGDLDLLAGGPQGITLLENLGGNRHHWLDVHLRGLTRGNSKNNVLGLGSTIEVRSGRAYQFREVDGSATHLGLGDQPTAAILRVVWTNGVPQDRVDVAGDQTIVEEQVLKGSCPFLYTWNGERIAFVTDLLWESPLGMPLAPDVWATSAAGDELVRVDGAVPRDGSYDLRITEELWEAAFFDAVRLWIVDHPAAVEVDSSLKIVPGEAVPARLLASREPRPVRAWDASGHDVTARVARRDEVYADGWRAGPYQGLAAEPWTFTFDLGDAPARPIRLLLDGWTFPADASLNLAVAQRADLAPQPPRLEMLGPAGWRVLMPAMGYPAGKTKTMVVDTPPLPPGVQRLRIVSNLWLSWDRIRWTTAPADDAPRVVARLSPEIADLRFRGFSALVRHAPNAPHDFDYARVARRSPWLPLPGRYTRYGDVRQLLESADDRSVILGAGDEIRLRFDASRLPPPPPGWHRTLFLESHGWDKDADRNTWQADQVGPLPYRAMHGYPYAPGDHYPDDPLHRAYERDWLTRVVPSGPVRLAPPAADRSSTTAPAPRR